MSVRRLPPPLVAISPGNLGDSRAFERALRAAWEAGLRGVVLREPALDDRTYLELARRVRTLCAVHEGGWFSVHDRAHLAEACAADAVHVGWRSLSPSELRGWLPEQITIGLSTHADDESERWSEADYLFHGPVFATDKPHPRPAVGLEGLRRATSRTTTPIWALGGLQPEHARGAADCTARGLAVLSGLLAHEEPAQRTRAYLAAWAAATIRA